MGFEKTHQIFPGALQKPTKFFPAQSVSSAKFVRYKIPHPAYAILPGGSKVWPSSVAWDASDPSQFSPLPAEGIKGSWKTDRLAAVSGLPAQGCQGHGFVTIACGFQ